MHDVENVLGDQAFWIALVVAAVSAELVWSRLREGAFEPGVGVGVVVAVLVAMLVDVAWPVALAVGLGLLVGGERIARDGSPIERVVVLLPGALVLGAALPDGWPSWIRAVVVVVTLVAAPCASEADAGAPRLVPLLLTMGSVGVYLCVPDTEAPKALLGALLAAAVLGLEPRLRHAVGTAAVAGLFVWVAAYGGLARPGSVVGGVACLGVLVCVPFLDPARGRRGVFAVVAVQAVLVGYLSRFAGLEHSAWSALLLAIPAFAVAAAVLVLMVQRRGRRASRS